MMSSLKRKLSRGTISQRLVCYIMLTTALITPPVAMVGCGGNDFLGLEDYQRDLLLGALGLAILNDGSFFGLGLGNADETAGQVTPGANGVNCWDLNGNGQNDEDEDTNGDGEFNTLDCQGAGGANGANGTDGVDGTSGVDGQDGQPGVTGPAGGGGSGPAGKPGDDGINCWDLNGNGIGDIPEPIEQDTDTILALGIGEPDPELNEDINGDGVVDVRDCLGADGIAGSDGTNGTNGTDGTNGTNGIDGINGTDGINCWDLNGNGIKDFAEDLNGDEVVDVRDCRGEDGQNGTDGADGENGIDGTDGVHCWDLDADGIKDFVEDVNGDNLVDVRDCRGTDGIDGTNGTDGLNCWDLNGDGIKDFAEDINGDQVVDVRDCRGLKGDAGTNGTDGDDGISCWDLNADGIKDLAEDINGDNVVDVRDCRGTDGQDGKDGENGTNGTNGTDGRNCWDLNGNGIGDVPFEDLNNDLVVNVLDCRGADGDDGQDGNDGKDGENGTNGTNGTDGQNCWDLNGNGIGDVPFEDLNNDLIVNVLDCRGVNGDDGLDGLNCWDLNSNGVADLLTEDANNDQVVDVRDCGGADGEDGSNGINCWDLNQNGEADLATEDINGDQTVDVLDCRGRDGQNGRDGQDGEQGEKGEQGPAGSILFDLFVEDFFTVEHGHYGSIPVGTTSLPIVDIQEPAIGACGSEGVDVLAYRMAIPVRYTPGNPVTMRMFIWRDGPPTDGCFVFRLDAFRASHGTTITRYGDERYIKLDVPQVSSPFGTLLVIDLPLNNPGIDPVDGLCLPNDLSPGDFLAFEVNLIEAFDDGGCYTFAGAEFYESEVGTQPLVTHASVMKDVNDTECLCGEVATDCPAVDIVFIMDTSDAMRSEGNAMCDSIEEVVEELEEQGTTVNFEVLAIAPFTHADLPDCLTFERENVGTVYSRTVPGDPDGCPGDLWGYEDGVSGLSPFRDKNWGPATAIVAQERDWLPDAVRLIVPISNAGPCLGDPCDDPGADRGAIDNAIDIANANGVIISPIVAKQASACVKVLAADAAAATGGIMVDATVPHHGHGLALEIASIIDAACTSPCDNNVYDGDSDSGSDSDSDS